MTHLYRTPSLPVVARPPWWRRALCAIGSHSRFLVIINDQTARAECVHCGKCDDPRDLDVITYLKALMDRRTTRTREQ